MMNELKIKIVYSADSSISLGVRFTYPGGDLLKEQN